MPSLVIAIATGIIITRAAADAQLGTEIPKQVMANPKALAIVAAVLLLVLLLPGFPELPVIAVLGALGWTAMRARAGEVNEQAQDLAEAKATAKAGEDAGDWMRVEPIEIRLGAELADAFLGDEGDLADRIAHVRRQFAQDMGFLVPRVRTSRRAELRGNAYEIHFQGTKAGQGELTIDRVLAINPGGNRARLDGPETKDPAYELPAQWIAEEQRQHARNAGYTLVDADTVVITHLSELVKRHCAELLTRAEAERMVNRLREQQGSLVEELVPGVLTCLEIQKVLQHLLREQVSIRHLEAILEVLVDAGRTTKQPDELAERVRERLGAAICQSLRDAQGDLHVMTLAPELERTLLANLRPVDGRAGSLFGDMAQLDGFMKNLASQAESMMGRSLVPVLLCPSPTRRSLRALLVRSMPYLAVLGLNEVPATLPVRSFAAIQSQ